MSPKLEVEISLTGLMGVQGVELVTGEYEEVDILKLLRLVVEVVLPNLYVGGVSLVSCK